jgi:endonuclease/exonuclease/phosphatase family metal-dependent hydrolase
VPKNRRAKFGLDAWSRLKGSVRRGRMSWSAALALLALGWAFARTPRVVGRPRSIPNGQSAPGSSKPRTEKPPQAPSSRPARESTESETSVGDAFTSAARCAALVGAGQRLARATATARFASWNLHWFPDGEPGYREAGAGAGADLAWVACALGWLDADVIAVQEVKQSPSAERALATLLTELNRLTKARYVARLDDCGSRVPQHVGLIWNEARVRMSELQTVAALNPHGTACESQLRPGLAARFKLPGGLDLTTVSAHFKSMADRHGFTLRGRSFAAIPDVLREVTAKAHDADFLLLGDLNTMGCEECAPVVSATDEVRAEDLRLTAAGLRLVTADAAGTELYEGRSTLLDHAVVSAAMREFSAGSKTHVMGACAAGARALSQRAAKQVRRTLSDHCPIVLDLTDRDLD